ncbi:unnamed protein product [Phytophthora fragariaefolia]|uniref:Unnamed protein product n=1 Tax=Phytophthora fragariaefolia TaxID=1490495 RepID=A0A9W6TU30_9STRA|nr:unnamed protein product [Phytophthora fragariaefolia]
MQEAFSLRQAKLHAIVPRPMSRPVVKPTGGPVPMDLSSATAARSLERRGSTNVLFSGVETTVTTPVSAQRLCTRPRADVTMPGIATSKQKLRQPAGAGPPAGNAVDRVDIGHAVLKTAAPSESHSHCKKKDDKPNLVILKSLARLDFKEVKLPRSLLEKRLATGVIVRTEKRVVRERFSYEEKQFVDELIVLDLDDTFDMVLGMSWLAPHDPVIDWAKRKIVRFRSSGATESDGPVGAAHAPRGACDPPAEAARTLMTERVIREKCEPNQKTQIRSDLRGSGSVKNDAIVSTVVDTQVEQEWPVTEGSDLGASAPGADAIGPNIKGRSAVRRRGKSVPSGPGAGPFARDLHDGRIEQFRIRLVVGRMKCEVEELKQLVTEGADALSANSKRERFDEQSWDSLKSIPLYAVLREYKDVHPDDIPVELPQDKGQGCSARD